ncbi:MAG: histone deacetylase [Leptospiraceae bacterium]|nr:histone deacetylase [Leptospiraceae bacterium]
MKKQLLPVFVYSENYNLDMGPHVFPAIKFGVLHERLRSDRRFRKHDFVEPVKATRSEVENVHSSDYVSDLLELKHSSRLLRSELPLTSEIVEAFFWACGGTLLAAREALRVGRAMNLGGGFHHAFRNQAEGFCYLNDVAVAIRTLIREDRIARALIIDLDVHQGNGTARIFRFDRRCYTFSMHEENNYPQKKERSNLDVPLPTAITDEEYLRLLEQSLEKIAQSYEPDLIFYLAGVDVYRLDRLGGLSLSREGIAQRDKMVARFMPEVPLVTVLAGGYAVNDMDTVDLHLQTCEAMADLL